MKMIRLPCAALIVLRTTTSVAFADDAAGAPADDHDHDGDELLYRGPPPGLADEEVFAAYRDLDDVDCASMRIPLPEKDWDYLLNFVSNNGTVRFARRENFDELPLLDETRGSSATAKDADLFFETGFSLALENNFTAAGKTAAGAATIGTTPAAGTGAPAAASATVGTTGKKPLHMHTAVRPRQFLDLSSDSQLIIEYLNRLIPQRDPELGKNIQGPWRAVLRKKLIRNPETFLIQCPKLLTVPGDEDASPAAGRGSSSSLETVFLRNGCPLGALTVAVHKVLCVAQIANLFLSRKHDARFTSPELFLSYENFLRVEPGELESILKEFLSTDHFREGYAAPLLSPDSRSYVDPIAQGGSAADHTTSSSAAADYSTVSEFMAFAQVAPFGAVQDLLHKTLENLDHVWELTNHGGTSLVRLEALLGSKWRVSRRLALTEHLLDGYYGAGFVRVETTDSSNRVPSPSVVGGGAAPQQHLVRIVDALATATTGVKASGSPGLAVAETSTAGTGTSTSTEDEGTTKTATTTDDPAVLADMAQWQVPSEFVVAYFHKQNYTMRAMPSVYEEILLRQFWFGAGMTEKVANIWPETLRKMKKLFAGAGAAAGAADTSGPSGGLEVQGQGEKTEKTTSSDNILVSARRQMYTFFKMMWLIGTAGAQMGAGYSADYESIGPTFDLCLRGAKLSNLILSQLNLFAMISFLEILMWHRFGWLRGVWYRDLVDPTKYLKMAEETMGAGANANANPNASGSWQDVYRQTAAWIMEEQKERLRLHEKVGIEERYLVPNRRTLSLRLEHISLMQRMHVWLKETKFRRGTHVVYFSFAFGSFTRKTMSLNFLKHLKNSGVTHYVWMSEPPTEDEVPVEGGGTEIQKITVPGFAECERMQAELAADAAGGTSSTGGEEDGTSPSARSPLNLLCLPLSIDNGSWMPIDIAMMGKNLPALLLLRLGVDFVVTDMDILYLKDPTPFLLRAAYGSFHDADMMHHTVRGVSLSYQDPHSIQNRHPRKDERLLPPHLDRVKAVWRASNSELEEKIGPAPFSSDFVVSEHWESTSVNNGFFLVRASTSKKAVSQMLHYVRWMHFLPFGHDQNGFDAMVCHTEVDEPCTPRLGWRKNATMTDFGPDRSPAGRRADVKVMAGVTPETTTTKTRRTGARTSSNSGPICPRVFSLNQNLFASGSGFRGDTEKFTPFIFHLTGGYLPRKLKRIRTLMGREDGFDIPWRPYLQQVADHTRKDGDIGPLRTILLAFEPAKPETHQLYYFVRLFARRLLHELFFDTESQRAGRASGVAANFAHGRKAWNQCRTVRKRKVWRYRHVDDRGPAAGENVEREPGENEDEDAAAGRVLPSISVT
eukprot:g2010.t1